MDNLYLPKETIAKAIAVAVVGVLSILKMFGVEVADVTETEVYTAVLVIADILVIPYTIYKNFVTSRENDTHTKQMKEDKANGSKAVDTIPEPADSEEVI